jgi:hypothetical protein
VATHLFQLAQNKFSGNFGNLLFLAVFHFWSRFEALNDVFWENGEKYGSSFDISPKMNLLDDTFPTAIIRLKRRSYAKVTTPGS